MSTWLNWAKGKTSSQIPDVWGEVRNRNFRLGGWEVEEKYFVLLCMLYMLKCKCSDAAFRLSGHELSSLQEPYNDRERLHLN